VSTHPDVEFDYSYSPVPLDLGRADAISIKAHAPDRAPVFAMKAVINVTDRSMIPETISDMRVFSNPQIAPTITCQETPPIGDTETVVSKLRLDNLHEQGLTGKGIAVAIFDSGINSAYLEQRLDTKIWLNVDASWRPAGTDHPGPGTWPVRHGTMCAYDVLIGAPDATLIDVPILTVDDVAGEPAISGTLSAALAANGFMMASWISGQLASFGGLVINNSWAIFHPSWDFPPGHPGRYCDNPQHPFNVQVSAASRAGIDIVFAAGNCGFECPGARCQGRTGGTIMGASAMPDVLTLAGCNTLDNRVGYSSQGPSIVGMYERKPDLTAYTHFLGSEALGAGRPDSGTSAACPVAAGCIAALRESGKLARRSGVPPSKLFNVLRETARPKLGSPKQWDKDYGFGIIDPLGAAAMLNIASS
jgi:Subtilase family